MERQYNRPWTRFHDDPRAILLSQVAEVDYPSGLADVIALCRDRPPQVKLHAQGSHWALSEAAISDDAFIETHDPQNLVPAMDRSLTEVVPGCLHANVLQSMTSPAWPDRNGSLVHFESGKRIYQAYAELDQVDPCTDPTTLGGYIKARSGSDHFKGPWAFETLGGAGGQTVVGAFSTGTHGGDFDRGALADSVVAIHLVADGGDHYWIEGFDQRYYPQLTDDAKLTALYGTQAFGGPAKFHIIRDQRVLNAVRVGVGRFGVIYSAVVRTVPQYALWERRRLQLWQDVKFQINPASPGSHGLFHDVLTQTPEAAQHFLQIVVCLTPHADFLRNLVGVSKRWQTPVTLGPQGHDQRVGAKSGDPGKPPVFALAGNSHPYAPDSDHPERAGSASFLERACSNASFLGGVLGVAISEIDDFVQSNGAVAGAGIAAVAAVGGGGLLALLGPLGLVAVALKALLDGLGADDRLGETLDVVKAKLLDPTEHDPLKRAAGLFAWQLIAYEVFQSLQGDQDYCALSYAVMDGHDYLDQSCQHNAASVEVFFDASDSRLIAFIDALIAFEIKQELLGKSFLGYASMRFTGPTQATIGMQRWPQSCAVEVAGLKDVDGTQEMVDYATRLALNPNMGGVLHWGQYNPSNRQQVEQRFPDSLPAWRAVLKTFNGAGGFSSAFTRRVGLEPS